MKRNSFIKTFIAISALLGGLSFKSFGRSIAPINAEKDLLPIKFQFQLPRLYYDEMMALDAPTGQAVIVEQTIFVREDQTWYTFMRTKGERGHFLFAESWREEVDPSKTIAFSDNDLQASWRRVNEANKNRDHFNRNIGYDV